MSQTPAQSLAHDLTNKLQSVNGFICLERFDKAQQSAREAAELLLALKQWIAVLENCCVLEEEKAG
jgi:hypothetical protein